MPEVEISMPEVGFSMPEVKVSTQRPESFTPEAEFPTDQPERFAAALERPGVQPNTFYPRTGLAPGCRQWGHSMTAAAQRNTGLIYPRYQTGPVRDWGDAAFPQMVFAWELDECAAPANELAPEPGKFGCAAGGGRPEVRASGPPGNGSGALPFRPKQFFPIFAGQIN